MKILSCVFVFIATLSTCLSASNVRPVLKFGDNVEDYIMFSPDMEQFTEQFSICSWVRKVRPAGNYLYWFHYAAESSVSEIRMTDHGHSKMFNGPSLNKVDQLGITPCPWFHYCMSWSASSASADVYFNGTKVGSITTPPGRELATGGSLVLGQRQSEAGDIYTVNGGRPFGGELYKLNIFSKKLTAGEVSEMYQAGISSDVERKQGQYRQLKWENIIQQPRNGNVQLVNVDFAEVDRACQVKASLAYVEKQLANAQQELDIMNAGQLLDQTQSELREAKIELEATRADLGQRLSQAQSELELTRIELEETELELEACFEEKSWSPWDILNHQCFFNSFLSEEKIASLNKVWERLESFKGVTVTKDLIAFLKDDDTGKDLCEV